MEKKNAVKQGITAAVLYAAVFAIYSVIVLFAFEGKNDVFWVSYAFFCVGLLANVGVVFQAARSDIRAVFMGIPLISFSVFYVLAEGFVSIVFMLFRARASLTLALVVQSVLLLIFVAIAAAALLTKNAVEAVEETLRKNVANIRNLSVDVKMLESACQDRELKLELHKAAEDIRFSDPTSTQAVAELDEAIAERVRDLKYYCESGETAEALRVCRQLRQNVSERKQRLILSK